MSEIHFVFSGNPFFSQEIHFFSWEIHFFSLRKSIFSLLGNQFLTLSGNQFFSREMLLSQKINCFSENQFVSLVKFIFYREIVRSCLLITLIKCLKGHRSLGSLFVCQLVKSSVSEWVSQSVTRSPIELFWTAKYSLYQVKS